MLVVHVSFAYMALKAGVSFAYGSISKAIDSLEIVVCRQWTRG
jgi:hypothetical protein